jgi:hypothetical protein
VGNSHRPRVHPEAPSCCSWIDSTPAGSWPHG